MKRLQMRAVMVVVALVALASATFAQGPIQKRVNYSINVRHALKMGDYLLPPGNYVLFQINQGDLNLFGLYQEDLTDEPIAMIRTIRIAYPHMETPEETSLILDMDESGTVANPVLKGWNISGLDGWEIISVVSKNDRVLTKIK